jgi:hypothetical protein
MDQKTRHMVDEESGGWPRLNCEKRFLVAILASFARVGSFDPADASECPVIRPE